MTYSVRSEDDDDNNSEEEEKISDCRSIDRTFYRNMKNIMFLLLIHSFCSSVSSFSFIPLCLYGSDSERASERTNDFSLLFSFSFHFAPSPSLSLLLLLCVKTGQRTHKHREDNDERQRRTCSSSSSSSSSSIIISITH